MTPPAAHTDGVVVMNWTGRPLVAVDETVTGDWVNVRFTSGRKVMVWGALVTVKVRLTGVPAL